MSNIIRKPYEISLWDDILVFVVEEPDGTIVEYEKYIPTEATGVVKAQYYKERKLCVIGSDTMESPARATAPKLVSNVNGQNTLTFNLYYKYYDEETDDMVFNPYHKLLTNERKIKLRHGTLREPDTKWYDFIIKNVQENSENKTFAYTCKDQFCNELSKSGFNIQLDAELENNMGTVEQLAETILEDSDWKVRKDASDTLIQYKEEPLYKIQLKEAVDAVDILNKEEITIDKNKNIYVFYSIISNQNPDVQFLYSEDGNFVKDDNYVIDKKYPNYVIHNVKYNEDGWPDFTAYTNEEPSLPIAYFTDEYRGNKVVRQERTEYDSTIDKYVKLYKEEETGRQINLYTENEYISPTIVQEYITNPREFESDAGWKAIDAGQSAIPPMVENVILNQYGNRLPKPEEYKESTFSSYIRFSPLDKNQYLKNSGPKDNLSLIGGFAENDIYVFRIRFRDQDINWSPIQVADKIHSIYIGGKKINEEPTVYFKTGDKLTAEAAFTKVTGLYNSNETYYVKNANGGYQLAEFDENDPKFDETIDYYTYHGWEFKLYSQGAWAYSDLITDLNLGLYIEFSLIKDSEDNILSHDIEECSLFLYATDMDGKMCVPGGEVKSGVKTKYYAYIPNPDYASIDDVQYICQGSYEKPDNLIPFYNISYEKIRSITATESNRFNLIQDLCETFECWPRFEIEHNSLTGEILLDENYRQKKWLSFHEYIGTPNYVGFKYGINLKSIQRTLNSDGIVSKLIVKDNANEFAQDGFCTIARAEENPSGENFILDFSYYIQQGMLDWDIINNDLYVDQNGYIGLYKKLKEWNVQRDQLIEIQSGLKTDIAKYQSNVSIYEVGYQEIQEELDTQEMDLYETTSVTYDDMLEYMAMNDTEKAKNEEWNPDIPPNWTKANGLDKEEDKGEETSKTPASEEDIKDWEEFWNAFKTWFDSEEVLGLMSSIALLRQKKVNFEKEYNRYKNLLQKAQEDYNQNEKDLKGFVEDKNELIHNFYKKYSRFLQEGSWINEDYIDDNLYYLDAESTLNTSAKPKVTYTINVLELSQLEEYENYLFALGDKTYIEDTEFFGWTNVGGVQTPYHEEIVVTEITYGLDQLETNTIKVQNFKTQFEDLFQRMAATTQSVEYHTGEYTKAAGVVTEQGTIDAGVLQNSFLNNSFILSNASDQSVVWDSSGITTTSFIKPNEIVRIVSGGIFLSNDGGVSYNTGITGSGINANYITTGQLNASKVNIMSGSFSTFRWDALGLNAYQFALDENNKPINFNYAKFVRLDQYGLYGINGTEKFIAKSEDHIWENAKFALTWKGFMLKNDDDGSVRITSTDDIQVLTKHPEDSSRLIHRIKIGRIDKKIVINENNEEIRENVYGIRISDAFGAPVMETGSDGELWLKNKLHIETTETTENKKEVGIGKLGNPDNEPNKGHGIRVIDANDKFIVYEDGHLKATSADIEGRIVATSGEIGGLTVEQWKEKGYEVVITSNVGNSMKQGTSVTLTARLYKGTEEVNPIGYEWYENSQPEVILNTESTYTFEVDFGTNGYIQYGCRIAYDESKEE